LLSPFAIFFFSFLILFCDFLHPAGILLLLGPSGDINHAPLAFGPPHFYTRARLFGVYNAGSRPLKNDCDKEKKKKKKT